MKLAVYYINGSYEVFQDKLYGAIEIFFGSENLWLVLDELKV